QVLPPPSISTLFPYTTLFRSRLKFAAHNIFGLVAQAHAIHAISFNLPKPLWDECILERTLCSARSWSRAEGSHLFSDFSTRDHRDRKSTRLNSSHRTISYAVF